MTAAMIKPNSLTKKTIGIIALALIISSTITFLFVVKYESEDIINSTYDEIELLAKAESAEIGRYFDLMHEKGKNQTVFFSNMISSKQVSRTDADNYMRRSVSEDSIVQLAWVVFKEGAFDGKSIALKNTKRYGATGSYSCSYYKNNSNEVIMDTLADFETEDWYRETKNITKPYILPPFDYATSDGKHLEIIGICHPIISNNKTIGMTGTNITVRFIDSLVSNISFFEQDFASLITDNGTYASHPKTELIGQNMDLEVFDENARRSFSNGETFRSKHLSAYLNNDVLDFYLPIKFRNYDKTWYLRISTPEALVTNRIKANRNKILVIFIFVVQLNLIIAFIILYFSLRPVTRISQHLNTLALQGTAGVNKVNSDSNDEIGSLSKSYNKLITSLGKTEKLALKLKASERTLTSALEASNIGLWDYYPQKDIVYVNNVWLTMLGYEANNDRNKLPNDYFVELLHPDDKIRTSQILSDYLANKTNTYKLQFRVRCANSEYKWIESSASIMDRNADNSIARVIGVHIDISEQKQQELDIQKNAQRLKIATESSAMVVWELDVKTSQVMFSDNFFDLFGYDPLQQDPFLKWQENIHPDDVEKNTSAFKALLTGTNDKYEGEFRYRKSENESYHWLSVHAVVVNKNPDGSAKTLIVTNKDIDKRKQQEVAILREEQNFRNLFEQSTDAIFIIDAETNKAINCNAVTVQLFGLDSKDEFINKGPGDLSPKLQYNGKESTTEAIRLVQKAITHRTNKYEWLYKKKNGELFDSIVSLGLVENDGKIVIHAIVRDVTEQKKQVQQIKESRERFESLFKNMPNGFAEHEIILDKDGTPIDYKFLYINPAFSKQTGMNNKVIGKTIKQIAPDIDNSWIERYGRVALTGKFEIFESYYPALKKHFRIYSFSNRKGHFATIFDDITQNKLVEEEINSISNILEMAQEVAGVGHFKGHIQEDILTCSKKFYKIFETEYENLRSLGDFLRFVHPDDLESVSKHIKNSIKNKEEYNGNFRIKVKSGIKHIRTNGVYVFDQDGNNTYILGTCQDFTAEKLAEQKIIEKERDFRNIFESSTDALFISNAKTDLIIDCNQTAVEMFKARKKETIIGKPAGWPHPELQPNGQSSVEFAKEKIAQVQKEGRSAFEYQHQTVGGKPFPCEIIVQKSVYQNKDVYITSVRDITERKKAEQDIMDAKHSLDLALKEAKMGTWTLDLIKDKIIFDAQGQNIIGMKSGTLKDWLSLYPPEDTKRIAIKHKEAVARQEKDIVVNSRVKQKDGSYTYVNVVGSRKYAPNGTPLSAIGICWDFSEQKKHETELEKLVNQQNRANELAKMGNWTIDFTQEPLSIVYDQCLAKIVGNTYQEGGKNSFTFESCLQNMLKTDKDGAIIVQKVQRDMVNPNIVTWDGTYKYTREDDGQKVWFRSRATIVRDKKGMPLKVNGTTQDISTQKKSEQDLLTQTELNQKLAHISSNYINVALHDVDNVINNALKEIGEYLHVDRVYAFNYNLEQELFSNTYEWCAKDIRSVMDEMQNMPISTLAPEWANTHRKNEHIHIPDVSKHQNKVVRNILQHQDVKSLIAFPMQVDGQLLGLVGFDCVNQKYKFSEQDISFMRIFTQVLANLKSRKSTENDLIIAKEEAESSSIAKSAFLANMSHEIRTPMNAIIGFSEVLDRTISNKEQQVYLDSIKSSGKALLGIINDILDLSKIEAGRMELTHELVQVSRLMMELDFLFKFSAEEKGLELITWLQTDFPSTIEVDELRLRQVIVNLVSNALKFTHKGHIKISLEAKNITDNTLTMLLKVEDTGIGISQAKHEAIFNDFTQENEGTTRNYGGTGLGLSITKKIVELFGGTVEVKSEQGKGSLFIVEIPDIKFIRLNESSEDSSSSKNFDLVFKPAKILVVDDIESNREVLKGHLDTMGFDVLFAKNGQEAVAEAKKEKPDLIFMDLRMPKMDGYEATKIIAADVETTGIPIVACTASIFKTTKDEIKENGFAGYLRKPILLYNIKQELKKHLKYSTSLVIEQNNKKLQLTDSIKDLLVDNITNLWTSMKGAKAISQQKELAKALQVLGKKEDCEWILNKGLALEEAVSSFNIRVIEMIKQELSNILD